MSVTLFIFEVGLALGLGEQDRCPVWAHLSVRARAHAHARWPARQGGGAGALAGVRIP